MSLTRNGVILSGPQRSTALDGLSALGVETTFHDDFTNKPDGVLTAGTLSDSGHAYTVRDSGAPWFVEGGYLTNTHSNPAAGSQSGYAGIEFPEGTKVTRIGVEALLPAGANLPGALTLVASKYRFTTASDSTGFSVAGCHTNLIAQYDNVNYQTLDGPVITQNTLCRGYFPTLERDTLVVFDIDIRGKRAVVTLPGSGDTFITQVDDKIDSQNGPHATLQSYLGGGLAEPRIPFKVKRWWADHDGRYDLRIPAAGRFDAGKAASIPGSVKAFKKTTGENVGTAITTSVSGVLYKLDNVAVPLSKQIRVSGVIWVDMVVPTTQVASSLIAYVDAGSSSYRAAETIWNGTTPYNGSGAAFTEGRALPFDMEIDLSAFEIGSLIAEIRVRLSAGTNGLFTFVDSGSASGGASTLRHSTLSITELP